MLVPCVRVRRNAFAERGREREGEGGRERDGIAWGDNV